MRFVIYDPETGVIRAVVTGSREIAEQNVRAGEAILEYPGFVSPRRHKVESGGIVPI
jgi:hypothetical protein